MKSKLNKMLEMRRKPLKNAKQPLLFGNKLLHRRNWNYKLARSQKAREAKTDARTICKTLAVDYVDPSDSDEFDSFS